MLFFCKRKSAYEMRISDLSSDVCSSDLWRGVGWVSEMPGRNWIMQAGRSAMRWIAAPSRSWIIAGTAQPARARWSSRSTKKGRSSAFTRFRSEEHTSELQSLMRISYAVFCLKKQKQQKHLHHTTQ